MAELVCGTGDRDTWLAARREGITATDLPVILGLVQWDSPFCLYWRKKGKLPEVEESDRMHLGSWLEVAIAAEWGQRTGINVLRKDAIHDSLWRSSTRSWQLATPDVAWMGENFLLECKTSATRNGWGDDGTSEVPAHVRAQVLWQMDTLDVAAGHVAVVFLPSGEFRSYTISHGVHNWPGHWEPEDCPVCKDIAFMRAEAFKFLANHLTNSIPPPVDGLQVTTGALRHLHAGAVKGKQAEIPVEVWNPWYGAAEEVKRWEAIKREHENLMRQAMGDATVATVDGEPVARRDMFKNPGYTVAPFEVDRLVRVQIKEDKADEASD